MPKKGVIKKKNFKNIFIWKILDPDNKLKNRLLTIMTLILLYTSAVKEKAIEINIEHTFINF